MVEYATVNEVRTMVRRFAALPLLKSTEGTEDVSVAFESAAALSQDESLPEPLQDKMTLLSDYIYSTWVGPNARFPVSLWSRFGVPGELRRDSTADNNND